MADALKHDPETHFEFGENWARYSQTITEGDLAMAEQKLGEYLACQSLAGQTFLDIGCGSGIHALAALRLGADSVQAIDIDARSVATAKTVLSKHWQKPNYQVDQANVFDLSPESSGRFDVVYSWGVLHHTGDMWGAIEAAAALVAPGGCLAIGIYRKTGACGFWRWEKALYTRSGKVYRGLAVSLYVALRALWDLLRFKSPLARIRRYNRKRGMKWYTDVIDWLGGYPYESASREEIKAFVEALGYRLEFSNKTKRRFEFFGSGVAEYRFVKT